MAKNNFLRAKFNELFTEFTRYLLTPPDFGEDIPHGAEVILLDQKDPGYTQYILKKAQHYLTPTRHDGWLNKR